MHFQGFSTHSSLAIITSYNTDELTILENWQKTDTPTKHRMDSCKEKKFYLLLQAAQLSRKNPKTTISNF